MENTQKLTIYAKEIKLGDGKSFVAFTTLVKTKWFKVKFTRECLTTPKEKGMYHMTINIDDVSIEKGKFYTDKNGVKKQGNPTIWINKVVELSKYTEEELKQIREAKLESVFGDDDKENIFNEKDLPF